MRVTQTEGIVIRYTNHKESDRMLTIFSPQMGKLNVLARGCRKPKSRFLGVSQIFCYGEYILNKYRDIYILSQGEIKNSFYNLAHDMKTLGYGSYLLNLTEEVINEGESNTELFSLVLTTLAYMSYGEIDPWVIKCFFELKLLRLIGYEPNLDYCSICMAKSHNPIYFSYINGGIICDRCKGGDKDSVMIDAGAIAMMKFLIDMNFDRLKVLKFSSDIIKQLDMLIPKYIEQKLEKKIRTNKFIDILY